MALSVLSDGFRRGPGARAGQPRGPPDPVALRRDRRGRRAAGVVPGAGRAVARTPTAPARGGLAAPRGGAAGARRTAPADWAPGARAGDGGVRRDGRDPGPRRRAEPDGGHGVRPVLGRGAAAVGAPRAGVAAGEPVARGALGPVDAAAHQAGEWTRALPEAARLLPGRAVAAGLRLARSWWRRRTPRCGCCARSSPSTSPCTCSARRTTGRAGSAGPTASRCSPPWPAGSRRSGGDHPTPGWCCATRSPVLRVRRSPRACSRSSGCCWALPPTTRSPAHPGGSCGCRRARGTRAGWRRWRCWSP